jgi:predicted alpha/beta-hydrolase family hydrolase
MHVRTSAGELPVHFNGPKDASTLMVLGHGAGSGSESDFMERFATGLAGGSLRVCRFDFPYMAAGRKAPDRQPVLEAAFAEVVEGIRTKGSFRRVIVGGKSLGGRIASLIAAGGYPVDGLVFLGYPLHPPGRPERIRDAHLHDISAPMLFVEGTRDPFCPLDTLERVRSALSARTEVVVVEDGDHSLKVRKSSGRDTESAWAEAIEGIKKWLTKRKLVDRD